MIRKLLSILALLCLTVSGAWAQTETLLITINSTSSFTSGSRTFNNIATVTFSSEVECDDDEDGWYNPGWDNKILSVAPAAGYIITKVKFYNQSGSAFDETSPFEATLYAMKMYVNGSSCGAGGVTKIEVYGYAGYNVTANLAGGAYWATFYSNAGNYQAPEGTQVFAVNLNTTTAEITMSEISDRIAKSGQGVVLKNSTTGSITMTKTETAPAGDFSANSLQGTMTSITNPGNAYVLNYKAATGAGFYKLSSGGTIGANKAYLTYSAGAREFFLFDETTGIEMPTAEDVNADAMVYDLQGRRVQNPTKGLYIVNGKKVFINK